MADAPEVQRGDTGDPMNQSLPQGEATALNENAKQGEAAAAQIAQNEQGPAPDTAAPEAEYQPQPVEFVEPDHSPSQGSGNDVKDFLTEPTGDNGRQMLRTLESGADAQPPKDVHEWLPALAEAAADPQAPEFVKGLLRVINYHLGK